MTWTTHHSFGLFAIMMAILSIIITFRILFQRRKAAPAQAQAYPTHNRLQQWLGSSRHSHPASHDANAGHRNSAIGLEERNHWDAAILAQNDEAAIRGLREDHRHPSRSLSASVHERDLAHEDGTVLVPPPPAYSQSARASGPASALSPLSAPTPRSITSSISTTTNTSTAVLPPLEHVDGETQPMPSPQTSTMPSQHFTTLSGNRYDLSSFAADTPGLQLPINDALEVAQRLNQLKGVFKPLVADEELASRAEARQRRGDAAGAGALSVRHADLNPVPNPRYYHVDPPQDLEESIRAANASTLPGIEILGELRGHHNGTPPSALPGHQNGVPPRIRTSGTPRPMVFGHRPVLRGPMPSQAATFAEDSEDENDQKNSPASRAPTAMNSAGALRTDLPRVRTPGTPRPMVFGTRPVFCGRVPSQAVTAESDHEDAGSDATFRGGALIDYDFNFKDEVEKNIRGGSLRGGSLHGDSLSFANFHFEGEDKDEILVAVVLAQEDHRPFSEHEEGMVRHLGRPAILKPGKATTDRAWQLRGGWLPFIAEHDTGRPAMVTWEEELSIPFKHSQHADTTHWQCQSFSSACVKCRAKPSPSAESRDEITMEQLDTLSRRHMWRFELHRAFQAIKEALIHTAIEEFLEAREAEQIEFLNSSETEQKAFTPEAELRGGYLSDLEDDHPQDEKDAISIPIQVQAILQAFKAIENAMQGTAQLDFKAMLFFPGEPLLGDARWEEFGRNRGKMLEMHPLERLWRAWEILDALEAVMVMAASERLWNTGEVGAEMGWTREEVAECRVKCRDRGFPDLTEVRRINGFATEDFPRRFLRANTGLFEVRKMSSIPTCIHGKTERKLEGIEVCEHGLKVPRVRYWHTDTPHPYRFMTFASEVWTDDIRRTIEELERMVVLNQILAPQPRAEGPKGWPMVGSEAPRIVSCMGPKRCLFLKGKDLKPKGPMLKGKAARYPQTLKDWLGFVEENDGDAMSILSDDEDYIEMPSTVIEANITMGLYKYGGVEVETQGLPYVNAARPGLCTRILRRKMKATCWSQGLSSWQRYADEDIASLRVGEYAMFMQASITLPEGSCEGGMKATGKISSATKFSARKTSSKKEVIAFPSGADPRLSWLRNWGFFIPAWQPRFRRSGKEKLRRLSEACRVLKPTLWDESPHRSQDEITQLPLQFSTDTSLRADENTPSPLSFRTSTSLRDDSITQLPVKEDLPYPEYPWKSSNLSSETSLRGGASGFLGLKTDLPYPEFPWEPSNLSSLSSEMPIRSDENARSTRKQDLPYPEIPWEPSNLSSETSLRGGGSHFPEASEAAENIAYTLARPRELLELARRPGGFDPYPCYRIRGPMEIRPIQKHNKRHRARDVAWRKRRGVQLKHNRFRWHVPTHHDPDSVYKWKDVAWNLPNTIFVPFDRRNRYSRGVSRADMLGGKYFLDGMKMRYAHENCRKPSQKAFRRSRWTRGVRRREVIWGEELVGSLSGLRGREFARSGVCGGEGGPSSGFSGLRGGQLTNEEEKDEMEGLECHGAQTTDDQEGQTKSLQNRNDAREYQIQCDGQDTVMTSASHETTSLTSNAFSYLHTPSSPSFLNQAFVPSPSPTVASFSHRKRTVLRTTMTWLALNNHHKRCRPGMCANPCRAIVMLPLKPPQMDPVSRLESINAIAYWFSEEADALCKPSEGALRGGFLMNENEEGKEDGQDVDWRSPHSMRDGEPDPLAHSLMTRARFSRRRVEMRTTEIHTDLGGHNDDCESGRCSIFCRASGELPASDVKAQPHENFGGSLLAHYQNASPTRDASARSAAVYNVHPYSQRIAELNRTLGLSVRTDFRDEYCVEGHTHPEALDVYTESVESRKSFRRLKGKRPQQPSERQMPPLLPPLPIRQKPHWWVSEFPRQVQKEMSPPATPEGRSLRGGDLDETFMMPTSGVNGWLFDRSTNWTFRRTEATLNEFPSETQGIHHHQAAGYQQLPDSLPLTPVVSHGAEKLAMVFEKMSFVSEEISPPTSKNSSVSCEYDDASVGAGYTLKCRRFNPYLCWPEWAYKLYHPPHSPYDSPACDKTGRWRRPVSRHLLAGILETLPETTGMFRRLRDGTIVRIGLQEMTAEERETMLEYAKGKKRLRRNSWGLYPCLEARLLVEEANELKDLKAGLRGGVLEYPPSGPLAVHFDGHIRWSFRCCGCRPMTPDEPVLENIRYQATTVYESSTDSSKGEDAIILSPTQSHFIDEQSSKWYSRPVDASKLRDRLSGLLQSKDKRFKDKHRNLVSIEMPTERTKDQARPFKPSEVLMSKIDSHKTRALKSKRTGIWSFSCGGLRGGGLGDDGDEEMEMDYSSPPESDDEEADEEWEGEDLIFDEQEMDYGLSVDLLPLGDAYVDLQERLREEHHQAMEIVERSRRDFERSKLQPKCRVKLRLAGQETRTSIVARLGEDSDSESDGDLDYDPNIENVAPAVYQVDTCDFPSRITRIHHEERFYDVEMKDFPTLPSSCDDLPDTPFEDSPSASDQTNHSSPKYSPDVSTRASSISSDDFPTKGMWVMVHPRVTQLLVAGTSRYKSKHLEKDCGLMRLHNDWANGTPRSMRLMTSSSAFRYELQEEGRWERKERERLRNMEKLQGILMDLECSIPKAEGDKGEQAGDEKNGVEVLVFEVPGDHEDDTHTISLIDDPDKEKEKKDFDSGSPIIEQVWANPLIQFIRLSRPEYNIVPSGSERSLEKKAKRLMADDEDVRRVAEKRRREKLARMVTVMKQAAASNTRDFHGRSLRGGLGHNRARQ